MIRLGDATQGAVLRLRRQRAARHLHDLGPRPILEALLEIEGGNGLDDVLARYSRLPVDVVRALDGDDFAPDLLAAVST